MIKTTVLGKSQPRDNMNPFVNMSTVSISVTASAAVKSLLRSLKLKQD